MKAVTVNHCVAVTMLGERLCPRDCVCLYVDTVTESESVTHRVGRHNDGVGSVYVPCASALSLVRVSRRLSHSHTATHTVSQYDRTLYPSRHDWGLSVTVTVCVQTMTQS